MKPEEKITHEKYLLRGINIMMDMGMVEWYRMETKPLKQVLRRIITCFFPDLKSALIKEELQNWGSEFFGFIFNKKGVKTLALYIDRTEGRDFVQCPRQCESHSDEYSNDLALS